VTELRTRDRLVGVLRNYWAPSLWRSLSTLLRDQVPAELGWKVRRATDAFAGLKNPRFQIDFPGSLHRSGDTLTLRLPRQPTVAELASMLAEQARNPHRSVYLSGPFTGNYTLEATLDLRSGAPDVGLEIAFAISVRFTRQPPAQVRVDIPFVDIDVSAWASVLVAALFPPALLGSIGVEEALERILISSSTEEVQSRLRQYVGSAFFNDDSQFNLTSVGTHLIEPVPQPPEAFGRGYDPRSAGYVDLLLIADGYGSRLHSGIPHMSNFISLTKAYAENLLTPDLENLDPFAAAYHSSLRLWRMPIVSHPQHPETLLARPSSGPKPRIGFANLARLADSLLEAREFFGRDPLILVVSAGQRGPRSFAAENLCLLRPGSFSGKPEDLQPVLAHLRHELGHTRVGGGLADEYTEKDNGNARTYFGPEPLQANASVAPSRLRSHGSWGHWAGRATGVGRSGEVQLAGFEGSHLFDRGIYRPANRCQMRYSDTLEVFCDVCREQVTLGLMHEAVDDAGSQYARMRVSSTQIDAPPRLLELKDGEAIGLPVVPMGNQATADYSLELVGCSLPSPWHVSWSVQRHDYTGSGLPVTVLQTQGHSLDARVHRNWTIMLRVSSRTRFVNPDLGGFDAEFEVAFTEVDSPTADKVGVPRGLSQWVPIGGVARLRIDETDGSVSWPSEAWLRAAPGRVAGFNLPSSVRFELRRLGTNAWSPQQTVSAQHRDNRIGGLGPATWDLPPLPPGRYVWRASTEAGSVLGPYAVAPDIQAAAFAIEEIDRTQLKAGPSLPQELRVYTSPPAGQVLGISAYAWHREGKPLTLEFELRGPGEGFRSTPTHVTPLLAPPQGRFHRDLDPQRPTIGVRGVAYDLGVVPDGSRFRVRSADASGRRSNWVEGPTINGLAGDNPMEEDAEFSLWLLDTLSRATGGLVRPFTEPRPRPR
jgi:hypothetical protein